ncbi:MAG: pyridoxal-phosphate dependent enzyme, partial [Gemmatimonadota bacterium]
YGHYHRTHELGTDGAPYKVEGVGGDKVPTTLWWDVVDEFRTVSDKDSMAMARRLAREEGILSGGSSGMNLCVALDVARALDNPDACVVTILCDTGERYLSKVFNDEWLQENQLLDAPRPTVADLLKRRHAGAPPLVQVAPAAQVRQALNLMSTFGVSQLPVIDNGKCVGSLVEGSLMTTALEQPTMLDRAVRDVMDAPFPVVEGSLTLDRLAPMLTRETPAALIAEHGKVVGIVSRYDVLQLMIGR